MPASFPRACSSAPRHALRAAALASSVALGAAHVHALPPPNTLTQATSVEFDGTCVNQEELLRALSRWVKRPGMLPADLRVRVVGRDAPTFRASFEIARAGHVVASRDFSGDQIECEQRTAVLSSALGLALENYLQTSVARPSEAPRPEPAPVLPPTASPWRGTSYAGLWAGVGLLPRPTWAGAFGAGASKRSWGIQAGALLTPIQELDLGQGTVRLQLLGGEFGVCRLARLSALPVEGCLEGRGALIRTAGGRYDVSLKSRDWFADGGARLQLELPLLARITLYVGGRVGVTLHGTTLAVRERTSDALLVSRDWPAWSYGLHTGIRFNLQATEESAPSGH